MRKSLLAVLVAICGFAMLAVDAQAAKVTVEFMDPAGTGYFDNTPAKRVGGNPGRTIGEQRRIAAQFAADIWGAALDSNVEIKIRSRFMPLACTATSAVLASAGPVQIFSDFQTTSSIYPNTWYAVALANKLAGTDLAPGAAGTNGDDINSQFNSNIGTPGCLEKGGWYYGLDGKAPAGITEMVNTLIHEFGHGLGFLSLVDESNGSEIKGMTDIYSRQLKDLTTGKTWDVMTNAERKASAINFRKVIWTGQNVTTAVPQVLQVGVPAVIVNSPYSAVYDVGTADFGPAPSSPGVTADVALVNDGTGASTSDGCEPFGGVSGKIALIDRGTCGFAVKAANAQAAGAAAVIIVNNVAGAPPGMTGATTKITIPVVSISLADGTAIKSQLAVATVNATVGLDMSHRAGADVSGHALVYTPNPDQPGSSVSHWDTSMFPNQIMEPFDTGDAPDIVSPPYDLTLPLFQDLGW